MPIEDGFGSVGDKTFYHRNGVCYLRRRVRSEFPGTIAQMQQLSVHLRALESWRQLPFDVQQRWNGYAVGVVSHRPPFDGKSGISGHNLFVSAYHGFATLGREHTPAPAPFAPFPSFLVKLLGASAMDDTLQIRWKLEALDPDNRYRMLCKVQLGLPGTGRSPGMLRNFFADRDMFTVLQDKDIIAVFRNCGDDAVERELQRLRSSFEAAKADGCRRFIMFLHYPPTNILEDDSGFTAMAEEYGAEQLLYAHSHGEARFHDSIQGEKNGVLYSLVSGDYRKWQPLKVLD